MAEALNYFVSLSNHLSGLLVLWDASQLALVAFATHASLLFVQLLLQLQSCLPRASQHHSCFAVWLLGEIQLWRVRCHLPTSSSKSALALSV